MFSHNYTFLARLGAENEDVICKHFRSYSVTAAQAALSLEVFFAAAIGGLVARVLYHKTRVGGTHPLCNKKFCIHVFNEKNTSPGE